MENSFSFVAVFFNVIVVLAVPWSFNLHSRFWWVLGGNGEELDSGMLPILHPRFVLKGF